MANANFPKDIKRSKITILSFTLENASEELSALDSNNLKFFRVEEPLTELGLVLRFRESNIHEILVSSFLGETPDSVRFRCPKLPYDRDARIGARRNPSNPDKTEKIFGYNAIIATSIESHSGRKPGVGSESSAEPWGDRKRLRTKIFRPCRGSFNATSYPGACAPGYYLLAPPGPHRES